MSRSILAVVDDMFFKAKIRAVAEAVGVQISFPRTNESLLEKAPQADLIIVDLHNHGFDPVTLATDLKNDTDLSRIPLLGFFSHVETELQRKALAAGYDQVVARSVFSRDLAQILSGSS